MNRIPGRLFEGIPSAKGSLIIIGGHEEKEGKALILREVARRVKGGKLVVATLASEEPEAMWQDFLPAGLYRPRGVRRLEHLNISNREDLLRDPKPGLLDDATVVFFTGGGQLRIHDAVSAELSCASESRSSIAGEALWRVHPPAPP